MSDALYLAELNGADLGGTVRLEGPEARHAIASKRTQVGERLLLSDGAGRAVRGEVIEVEKSCLTLRVDEVLTEPLCRHHWVAMQGLAKGDRSELAVEMMTEMGVDEVMAWQASRSIVRWNDDRTGKGVAKWRATAREATKQSRRFTIPTINAVTTKDIWSRITTAALAIVLHEDATDDLSEVTIPSAGEILFIIGPEGGITPAELEAFIDAGAKSVCISDGVLRTSTAGVVALAQLQALSRARA